MVLKLFKEWVSNLEFFWERLFNLNFWEWLLKTIFLENIKGLGFAALNRKSIL